MSKIPGQTLICKPSKLFSERTGGGSQKPIPLKEYKEPHYRALSSSSSSESTVVNIT